MNLNATSTPEGAKPAGVLVALSLYAVAAPPVGLALLLAASPWIEPVWADLPAAASFVLVCLLGTLLVGSALLPSIGFAAYVGYLLHGELRAYTAVVLTLCGATLVGLTWARLLSSSAARRLLDRYPKGRRMLDEMERESGRSLLSLVFMSRLSPHMPFAFTNILVAQLGQPLGRLSVVSTLGLLPRSMIAVAFGAGLRSMQDWSRMPSLGYWPWVVTAIVIVAFIRIAQKAYRATRDSKR